jgi:hypothetical protein
MTAFGEGSEFRSTQRLGADLGSTRSPARPESIQQAPVREPLGGDDDVRILPAGLGYPVPSGAHRMSLQRPQSIVRAATMR